MEDSCMFNRGKKRPNKILVVAPEFPLINQPWMDNYLEQLVYNDIEFSIFSLNRIANDQSSKVDKLGFLRHTKYYSLDRRSILGFFLKNSGLIFPSIKILSELRRKSILKSLSSLKLLLHIFHFYLICREYRDVDLIHSHSESISHRFIVLAEMLHVPLVITFHGLPPKGVAQLSSDKREELYQYAQKVFVNTEFAKKKMLTFGCSSEKIEVLPQGLPVEEFPFRPVPFPAKGEILQILSVGRFHRDKGHHYSLLALRRLLNDGMPVYWTFVGVGPELAKLKALAKKLNLDKNITFYEKASVEKVKDFYSKSHVFVLASIDTPGAPVETQGVVLQEAQASGCIVIATRTGGIPECLNHRQDAILVPQQSSREISSAIKYLYFNPDVWSGYRAKARENVKMRFNAKAVGGAMAKILKSIQNSDNPEGRPMV